MKRNRNSLIAILSALVFMVGIVAPAVCAADETTITGTISEDGILITDAGVEYTIADNDQKEQIMEHAGKSVTAVGAVTEEGSEKIITVSSFKVVAK